MTDSPHLRLLGVLADCWERIRKRHPDVPRAAILMLPREDIPDDVHARLSFFADPDTDMGPCPPMFVGLSARAMRCSAEDLLSTLLHEAAHALDLERGGPESRTAEHGPTFKAAAEELGLVATCEESDDYRTTAARPEILPHYTEELEKLSVVLSLIRDEPAVIDEPIGVFNVE